MDFKDDEKSAEPARAATSQNVGASSSRLSWGEIAQRWSPALRHSYFRWYLTGHLFSVVGSWMQDSAIKWYIQELTRDVGSESWLGLHAAIAALPIVVLSPLGGILADHVPRRWMVVVTQIVGMLIALSLGILHWFNALPLALVLSFGAIYGAFLAFDIPARQAFAIEMVGRKDLMSAIGLNSTIFNLGRLLGPMAFAAVMTLGLTMCFLLNSLSFIALIVVLGTFALPRHEDLSYPSTSVISPPKSLWDGYRHAWRSPPVRGLLIALALFCVTGGCYQTLLAPQADYVLRAGKEGYSALLTANGMGSVVGALIVASLHSVRSRRVPIVLGLLLVSVSLIGNAWATTVTQACLCLALTGSGFILFLAAANSTIQLGIDNAVRGRVMSLWVLVFGAALPVGNLLVGQLASMVGTPTAFLFQGVACFGTAGWAIYALRVIEKSESASSPTHSTS